MFEKVTQKLTQSVCNNDAESLANLFAAQGTYHDYIYGSFRGKENIKLMLNNYFHRDAKNLYWEMSDHVFRDDIGYAKYVFTFTSKVPDYLGKKVVISGISFFRLKFNSIVEYSESVNGGIAMVQLGVKPAKMEKVFLKWFKHSLENDSSLKKLYETKGK